MWEINSWGQYLCFIYSICLGGVLGLIYDFFKFDRIVFKRKNLLIFLQDILFWLISAFMFFSFAVVFSNGQIRAYLLFGSFFGFLIYRLTLSKLFMLITTPIKKLNSKIVKQYLKIVKKLNFWLKNFTVGIEKFIKRYLFLKKQKNIKNN